MPAVTPTTQSGPPRYITPEEHKQLTASTPTSFGDIPPVLQHKEENVQVTFDPPIPELESTDKGTLYVIESTLAFVWPSGTGFTIEYPRITLHAVSRGESGSLIYCQLDESDNGPNDAEAEEQDTEMREMKIIPSDPASIEPIFEALSQCAALHPDPDEDDADDGWEDGGQGESEFETFDGASEQELSEVGRAALAHLESIIVFPEDTKEKEPSQEALEDALEDNDSKADEIKPASK